MVKQPHHHAAEPSEVSFGFYLITRYPLVMWLIALVLFCLVASISAINLLNPGRIEPPPVTSKIIAEPVDSAVVIRETLTVWLFTAIAISGVGGLMWLVEQLESLVKSQKPVQSRPQPRHIPSPRQTIRSAPRDRKRPPQPISKRSSQPLRTPSTSKHFSGKPKSTRSVASKPVITVVPAEESHPLDWNEASLADLMDVRKRRNLSSFL